jgi:hypothetical protein
MPMRFSLTELREAAKAKGQHRPACWNGTVNWERVEEEMALSKAFEGAAPTLKHATTREQMQRVIAMRKYLEGDFAGSLAAWRSQSAEPHGPMELVLVAEALASTGDESAVKYIEELRKYQPVEADVTLARLRIRQSKSEAGAEALIAAFKRAQEDPWASRLEMRRGMTLAAAVGKTNSVLAKRMGDVLRSEFAVAAGNETRQETLVQLANSAADLPLMLEALSQYEPFVPWNQDFLAARANAYKAGGHPLTARALAELADYRRGQGEAVLEEISKPGQIEDAGKETAMLEKQ